MSTFTMRLPAEDYEALQAMSLLTGQPMAELVRDAIAGKVVDFASTEDMQELVDSEVRTRQAAVDAIRRRAMIRSAPGTCLGREPAIAS